MKTILTISLAMAVGVTAFAQGNILFQTSTTKNTVFYSTDGTLATLTPVGTDGTAGFYGTVNYVMLSAPTGTAPLTQNEVFFAALGDGAPAGWTETPITGVTYSSTPGVINGMTITTPASSGAGGANALVEIYAYTGLGPGDITSVGFSGADIGTSTVTYDWTSPALGNLTTSTGALGWSQPTAATTGSPPPTPASMITGSAGFGSIVLGIVGSPEPSTMALCGLGAASLLFFRRRK